MVAEVYETLPRQGDGPAQADHTVIDLAGKPLTGPMGSTKRNPTKKAPRETRGRPPRNNGGRRAVPLDFANFL